MANQSLECAASGAWRMLVSLALDSFRRLAAGDTTNYITRVVSALSPALPISFLYLSQISCLIWHYHAVPHQRQRQSL